MAKCKLCGKTVHTATVMHDECLADAVQMITERVCDSYCKHPEAFRGDESEMHQLYCNACPLADLLDLVR